MTQQPDMAQSYSQRRQRLAAYIDEGIALINSAGVAPDRLLFDKNLQYLTGQSSRRATLLLAPNGVIVDRFETLRGPEVGRGRKVNEVLFVEELTEREKIIDGEGETFEEIREASGIEAIYTLSKMSEIVGAALMKERVLYLNTPGNPGLDDPLPAEIVKVNELRERYYWLRLENIAPKIHEMRRVKEPIEIDNLRRAFAAHAKIFEKIMRALKPGENESLGQAIFEYEVRRLPAQYQAGLDLYESSIIVGAGKNAAVAHYMDNDQDVKDGDLVLLDSGVAYNGYSSDISTTFPANGRFSPRQRELYATVLEAQKRAIATMRPGSSALEAHKAVYDYFKSKDVAQYGYGNCGHPVGLNIHDANGDGDIAYDPGVVLVIEPFIAIPEEGIGIRIESGVVITEDGCEILPEPPKEIDEVEALCRRD